MKKAIAVLCSLVLVLGVLCACQKDEPDATTESAANTTESSKTESTKDSSSESTSKKTNEPSSNKDETEKPSDEKTSESNTAGTTEKKTEKKAFPSFEAEDIFGAKVSSKVFSKKKLTVVNVFATWGDSNEVGLEALSRLQKELKNVGFLGIVLDINEGDGVNENALRTAKKLCTAADADYSYLITNDSLTEFCKNIYNVPVTYFVDNDGNIVGDPIVGVNSADSWKDIIEQKLAML